MMTRNNVIKASYKAHTGVEAAIRELRRFCSDLQKLAIVGGAGRADQIARKPGNHRHHHGAVVAGI